MIKALIFDAGGVLFNSSESLFKAPIEYISKVAGVPFERVDRAYRETIVECESHEVDKRELWELVMKKLDKNIPYTDQDPIREGFRKFQRFEDVFLLISKLKSKYKLALVSNANAVESGTPQAQAMYKFFDVVDLSYKIGFRKPDPHIYENAFKKLAVGPSEMVFIDNVLENVEEAKKLGMIGILFENAQKLEADLKEIGVDI